jgi:nitrogen fixation/metabolism regulation signal transduction histidine kinase
VKQGQETVERGQEVVRESQKVSAVVHMNIVKDPVYGSNPELAAVFSESARDQDKRLEEQQQKLEGEATALQKRSQDLSRQRTEMFVVLITLLSLLVVGIGVAGIVVTHRVAGPIHKMKRLLGYVGDGHLRLTEKLRKGTSSSISTTRSRGWSRASGSGERGVRCGKLDGDVQPEGKCQSTTAARFDRCGRTYRTR